jgi:hypothetical protein
MASAINRALDWDLGMLVFLLVSLGALQDCWRCDATGIAAFLQMRATILADADSQDRWR